MRLAFGLLLSLPSILSCGARQEDAAIPTSASWFEIARTPDIVAYLDTARIEHVTETVSRVWLRFVYTTPMQIGSDTTGPLKASEVRDEIDCQEQQAKDLEMRVETVAGIVSRTPTSEAIWRPFNEHPLGSGVFLVACRASGSMVTVDGGT
jgi:hypothetical protein